MEKMYRVLLANGSEEFCGKLGVALKQTNRYSVVGSACDGVRAISLLKELKPDLLVVDLMLPQADGLSVLKAAAGLDPKPKLLVLVEFVTEYVSSMFMTLGVQYIMLKPCSCRAVVERLDEICESAVSRKPAIAAKYAPLYICRSTPMLNMPPRKAKAAAMPVNSRGVVQRMVEATAN